MISSPMQEILDAKTHRNEHTKCLIWEGEFDRKRQPIIEYMGTSVQVIKILYTLARGSIPAGADIVQKCENQRCVEIEHLELGQAATSELGFAANEEELALVKKLYFDDGMRQDKIAEQLGVSASKVSRMITYIRRRDSL